MVSGESAAAPSAAATMAFMVGLRSDSLQGVQSPDVTSAAAGDGKAVFIFVVLLISISNIC